MSGSVVFLANSDSKDDASHKHRQTDSYKHTLGIKAVMQTEIDEERKEKRRKRRKRVEARKLCTSADIADTHHDDDDQWDDALPLRLCLPATHNAALSPAVYSAREDDPLVAFFVAGNSYTPQSRQGVTVIRFRRRVRQGCTHSGSRRSIIFPDSRFLAAFCCYRSRHRPPVSPSLRLLHHMCGSNVHSDTLTPSGLGEHPD